MALFLNTSTVTSFLLGSIIFLLMLLPVFLIGLSGPRLGRLIGGSGYLVFAGSLLLAVLFLDFFVPLLLTTVFRMDAETFSKVIVSLNLTFFILKYIGLVLLGVGLMKSVKKIEKRLQQ